MFHQWDVQKEWVEEGVAPFDELILSWNSERPAAGLYHFYVKVKTDEWSPWILYASWGKDYQGSGKELLQGSSVQISIDTVEVVGGLKGVGFQVKVEGEGDAHLSGIDSLHVYVNSDSCFKSDVEDWSSCSIPLQGISQIELEHPRSLDLCSPVSTAAVVRYLSKSQEIDPLFFAKNVFDETFDIFGNWVFSVAEGWRWLGKSWSVWVERFRGFSGIHANLERGVPVVVSVRGPLVGSALPYKEGHLLVVVGYKAVSDEVLCMDPAFPCHGETYVAYPLSDFLKAWGRRGNIAYVFSKKENLIE